MKKLVREAVEAIAEGKPEKIVMEILRQIEEVMYGEEARIIINQLAVLSNNKNLNNKNKIYIFVRYVRRKHQILYNLILYKSESYNPKFYSKFKNGRWEALWERN